MKHNSLPGEQHDHHIAAAVEHDKSVRPLFHRPVKSVLPEKHTSIITIKSTDSIAHAFKVLIDHGILSAPVYCVKERRYTGFIDVVDMLAHALTVLSEPDLIGGEFPKLIESKERFGNEQVGTIVDLSKRNPWKPVDGKTPVSTAIQMMCKWKVHRVPVIDSDGELITLVTQSQMISLIHSTPDVLPSTLGSMTVGDLKLGYTTVDSVSKSQNAVDAFKIMHEKGYSAVAVVNQNNQLVGNISVSDLKLIGYDAKMIEKIFIKVEEFLKLIPSNETLPGPICVHPTATFEEVVSKMVIAKVHRVYVIDPTSLRPIGVVSQSVILKAVRDNQK